MSPWLEPSQEAMERMSLRVTSVGSIPWTAFIGDGSSGCFQRRSDADVQTRDGHLRSVAFQPWAELRGESGGPRFTPRF
jgi:hypothetical protein